MWFDIICVNIQGYHIVQLAGLFIVADQKSVGVCYMINPFDEFLESFSPKWKLPLPSLLSFRSSWTISKFIRCTPVQCLIYNQLRSYQDEVADLMGINQFSLSVSLITDWGTLSTTKTCPKYGSHSRGTEKKVKYCLVLVFEW